MITRKKIDNKDKWALEINDKRVGVIEATYRTATQRSWNATISVKGDVFVSNDKFSVKQAVIDLENQIEDVFGA